MASFTINIPVLNEAILNYKDNSALVQESLDTVYQNLKLTEDAWHDEDSTVFMNNLRIEKDKIDTYLSDIAKIYTKIENFKEDIDSIFPKYGYSKNSVILKYDDSKVSFCITKLKNAYTYLDNALRYINMCNFDSDFSEISKVKKLKTSLRTMKTEVDNVKSDLSDFKARINEAVSDAKVEISRNSGFNLDVKFMEYAWKLNNPELKNFEKLDKVEATLNNTKITEIKASKINVDEDKVKIDNYDFNTNYGYNRFIEKDIKNDIEVLDVGFSKDIENNEKGFSKTLEDVNATAVYNNKNIEDSIMDDNNYIEIFPDIDIPKRLDEE